MFTTLLTVLLVSIGLSTALPATPSFSSNKRQYGIYKNMFVFGDSYSTTSYSWSSSDQPRPANPLGNPDVGTGTRSGGYNWVDFVTVEYNASLLYTYNAAVSGSTVDQSLIQNGVQGKASDFPTQLQDWKTYNRDVAPSWRGDNTLFASWFGVNDVHKGFGNQTVDDLFASVITEYFNNIRALYNAGARNFAILGLPPVSRTQVVREYDNGRKELFWAAQKLWAKKLQVHLDGFCADHSDVEAKIIDTRAAFTEVLNHPHAYDLPDSICTNIDGTSCPWRDALHPGVKIQREVAKAVAAEFPNFFTS